MIAFSSAFVEFLYSKFLLDKISVKWEYFWMLYGCRTKGDYAMKRQLYDPLRFSGTWFAAMWQMTVWLLSGKRPITVNVEFVVKREGEKKQQGTK